MGNRIDPKIPGLLEERPAKAREEAKERDARNLEQALRELKARPKESKAKLHENQKGSLKRGLHGEKLVAGKNGSPMLTGGKNIGRSETPPLKSGEIRKPEGSAKKEPSTSSVVPKEGNSKNINASHFVVAKPSPSAELVKVLKTQVPPIKPPSTEEGGTFKNGPLVESPVQEKLDPKGVVAPPQAGQGNSVDIRQARADAHESFEEDEEGEAKETKDAKSAQTTSTSRSKGDGKLEAASSGVASGGGGQESISEKDSGVQFLGAEEGKLEKAFVSVFESYSKLKRYVYQQLSQPQADKAMEVFEQALSLNSDPELLEILERGRAARLNPYGVFHG